MEPKTQDERLWKIAKKRAAFKQHLSIYVLVNLFLWGIWWFTQGHDGSTHGVPWPAWTTLGWGLGLGFNYFSAYGSPDKQTAVEQEYEKLLREQGK
jgi:hypothetical protein